MGTGTLFALSQFTLRCLIERWTLDVRRSQACSLFGELIGTFNVKRSAFKVQH